MIAPFWFRNPLTLYRRGIRLAWCAALFFLGILRRHVKPTLRGYFRRANSWLFVLIPLGLMIRLRVERSQYEGEEFIEEQELRKAGDARRREELENLAHRLITSCTNRPCVWSARSVS